MTVLAHLLVACIQIHIRVLPQRTRAPGVQHRIELGCCAADLRRVDLKATQVLGDRRHFAGRDALNVHLGQRQLERALRADAFLQALGIEAALAHLGHGDGEGAETGVERLVLEAVGLRLALGAALVGVSPSKAFTKGLSNN